MKGITMAQFYRVESQWHALDGTFGVLYHDIAYGETATDVFNRALRATIPVEWNDQQVQEIGESLNLIKYSPELGKTYFVQVYPNDWLAVYKSQVRYRYTSDNTLVRSGLN